MQKAKTKHNKRFKFEQNLELNIEKLTYQLNQRTYKPSRSICFVILKPKPREIFAAEFKDRIVHHLLFNYLNTTYEKKFIYDSYACRKNKGTLASVKKLQKLTLSATNNNQNRAYYLQLDIHNFFMSIDKHILFNIVKKHLKDNTFYWLAKILIYHNPTNNYINKTPINLQDKVPFHKSLPNQKSNQGLPIGNLTSQFFANVYLNELDQFVKHNLNAKYYIRYVDDFVILHKDKMQLKQWQKKIEIFLSKKLHLKLKPLIKIHPISNGINFVGYIIRPNYLLPRNRIINNIKTCLKQAKKECTRQNNELVIYKPSKSLKDSLSSYFGYLKHAKNKRIILKITSKFTFLNLFYNINNCKIIDFWKNNYSSFKNQKDFFENITKDNLLCMKIKTKYIIFNAFAANLCKLENSKLYIKKNMIYTYLTLNQITSNLDIILKNAKYCIFTKEKINQKRALDFIVSNNGAL